ncbi:MAG: PcfJ domain-containing protein [Lachnospiraceae bacterium]|nr:PcfJ domain-containing protein [Lachnospiraceae bacterium]
MRNDRRFNILDIMHHDNEWTMPEIPEYDMAFSIGNDRETMQSREFLHIFQIEPYIDSIYIRYDGERIPIEIIRFVFKEGYYWSSSEEKAFDEKCLKNSNCGFSGGNLDRIFSLYTSRYPDWHLQRYFAKGLRMLDHIYNCMRKNTAKELLYKAGLDELAVYVNGMDELNLLAGSPSELYDGLSVRILRSLNCREGAILLNDGNARRMIHEVNLRFPNLFGDKLNDSQCRYLGMLIGGNLLPGEVGRLFGSRKKDLGFMWCRSMYDLYIQADQRKQADEKRRRMIEEKIGEFGKIDPIYPKILKECDRVHIDNYCRWLDYYLLQNREKFDRAIRRSNRKRKYEWQERSREYFVRYPQTINDYCREAMYMRNCLDTYIEAYIRNDTTILFMRESSDVNKPYITIEIYENKLMQAYHRFNKDCSREETIWIREYCKRHEIDPGKFRFDSAVDELY